MDRRAETMQHHGVLECPDWCTQYPDEDQYEDHRSDVEDLVDDGKGGLAISARMRRSWWEESGIDAGVEMFIGGTEAAPSPYEGEDPPGTVAALLLGRDEVETFARLVEMVNEASEPGGWQWAYDGAEEDNKAAKARETVDAP